MRWGGISRYCQVNRYFPNPKPGVSTIAMFSVLGIDFGTNSLRALVVDCATGKEMGGAVVDYPTGDQGVFLDKRDHHLARQNPADYLFGLEQADRRAGTSIEAIRIFRGKGHRHRRRYHRFEPAPGR